MSGYYNRNNRGITKKLGPVTAYADAVLAGYKGTREQWAQDMAKLGQNVTQVAQNTKLTTELAEQTRVNTEQVEKDTADVRRLADETSDNAAQVASNTEESNRLAEETKQAAAQAKEDAEYAGAAADNFRVDTTLSEEGKAAEAKTTGEKFAQLSEEIDNESVARNAAIAQERNRAVQRENKIEALFSMPTQEAVSKWLDEHPEATTTVRDKSLEVEKFTDDAKKYVVKDYITPQMFGAKGDGVTDDTQAIKNAVTYCIEHKKTLLFPHVTDSYFTTETICIHGIERVQMESYIQYGGDTVGMVFGKAGETYTASLDIKVKSSQQPGYITEGAIGVQFINIYTSKISISCQGFATNIQCVGDGKGFVYNAIYFGDLLYGRVMVELTQKNGGWCNENAFYNGRFANTSTAPFRHEAIGVLISSTENYANNNNNFYNTSIEGFNPAVKIERGNYNHFVNIRTEGCEKAFVTENASMDNTMIVGYGEDTHSFDAKNTIIPMYGRYEYSFRLGNIAADGVSNNSNFSGKTLYAITNGRITKLCPHVTKKQNSLTIVVRGCIGYLISTPSSKEINVQSVVSGKNGSRIVVVMFDENMNPINEKVASVNTALNTNYNGMVATVSGASSTNGYYLFPDECKYVFIGVGVLGTSDGAATELSDLILMSNGDFSVQNISQNVSIDSIPTCEGQKGDFVFNSGSGNNIGWVYDGETWVEK